MKKGLTVLTVSALGLLLVGCGKDSKITKEDVETNSNTPESNITSNIDSNITSNITSNDNSNITSNITSNVTSNVTSNGNTGSNSLLACTMDYSSQLGGRGYKSAIAYTNVKFTGGTAKVIEMQYVIELDSTYASQIDMFVSAMQSSINQQYSSIKGVKVTSSKIGSNKFDVKIVMDVTQMSAEELKSSNFDSFKTATYDQVKQALVQAGYTCK